jgi:hypothetical protein
MSDALFNPAKAALNQRGEGMIEQADYRIGIEERAGYRGITHSAMSDARKMKINHEEHEEDRKNLRALRFIAVDSLRK